MKSTYLAIEVQENGKYYAYGLKVNSHMNLLSELNIKGIVSATICDSKKHCEEMVDTWNAQYKANENYLFDDAPLF